MPPLICASPVIIDQSFPRDQDELKAVAFTLGEIQRQIENGEINLVLTKGLAELVEEFDWSQPHKYSLMLEIYKLLNQWFLKKNDRLIRIDLSSIVDYKQHPIPEGCNKLGLVDLWADEVGRLLKLHDRCTTDNSYFIGIACEQAYSGSTPRCYCSLEVDRYFPLVGPNDIPNLLIDAYDWESMPNIHNRKIYISDIFNNYRALGASEIKNPSGGSHYKMIFPNKRPWVISSNIDPIPDTFLDELIAITGYPIKAIKTALCTGEKPRKILRLSINNVSN